MKLSFKKNTHASFIKKKKKKNYMHQKEEKRKDSSLEPLSFIYIHKKGYQIRQPPHTMHNSRTLNINLI